ncbi:MAG: polysaccharide deacetylase family protein [Proteobacteria bacterium]|nr:polysaccharide deacetylase family protein [Pseudomonadota bacterium]
MNVRPAPLPPAAAGWLVAALAAVLAGCASPPVAPPVPPAATPLPPATGSVLGRSARMLVYLPHADEGWNAIAARFLGQAREGWQVAQANPGLDRPQAGQPVVVPLVPPNPLGVTAAGAQGITILCYHRVGLAVSRMEITPARFEAQMQWLADAGYRVVSLAEVAGFLAGRRALPPRSVAITFDDGYQSVFRHAFPVLQRLGYPATLFVYTDFLGSRDAVTPAQMRQMAASGLMDVQAHGKSHANLIERLEGEADSAYRHRIDRELLVPRAVLERNQAQDGGPASPVRHLAYPYGDANDTVLAAMTRNDYELGLTVDPGTNRFYAAPLLLRRVMIYGDRDLADFQARVQGQTPGTRREAKP